MITNNWIYESKFGFIGICEFNQIITKLTLPEKDRKIVEFKLKSTPMAHCFHKSNYIGMLIAKLESYFEGKQEDFSIIQINMNDKTVFQTMVMSEVRKIGYGETKSYSEIASLVGSPYASRAVGNIMAYNPVPIIIPCHRVVRSDGTLGGFSGGIEMKKELLKLEGAYIKNA